METVGRLDSIGHSTSISIALVLALAAGAFWTGAQTSTLTLNMEMMQRAATKRDAMLEKLTQIAHDAQVIASENRRRLEAIEKRGQP